LATRLDLPFFDLDELIEERTGESIPEIFAHDGEASFRAMEMDQLNDLCRRFEHFVLATGGGTACIENAMEFMNSMGITVYLQVSANELCRRLRSSTLARPMLAGVSNSSLNEFVEIHIKGRIECYAQSRIIHPNEIQNHEQLLNYLEEYRDHED